MNTQEDNYYQILKIPETASPHEIDKAYELVWQSYEVDALDNYSKSSDVDSDTTMQRISCAYMTLIDPVTRIRYDQTLRSQSSTPLVEKVTVESVQPSSLNNYFIPIFHGTVNDTPQATPQDSPQEIPPLLFEQTQSNLIDDTRSSDKAADFSLKEKYTKPPAPSGSRNKTFAELMDDHLAARSQNRKVIEKKNRDSQQKMANFLSTIKSFNGELLQQIRQLKSVQLEEVAQETCVQYAYLEAIECEEFSKLPNGLVYVKNYIRAYARCLELPVQKVTEDCLKLYNMWQRRFSTS